MKAISESASCKYQVSERYRMHHYFQESIYISTQVRKKIFLYIHANLFVGMHVWKCLCFAKIIKILRLFFTAAANRCLFFVCLQK